MGRLTVILVKDLLMQTNLCAKFLSLVMSYSPTDIGEQDTFTKRHCLRFYFVIYF